MKKIVCITGTRPQIVKHAILSKMLQKSFDVQTIHTAQHYQFELSALLEKELFTQPSFHRLSLPENAKPAQRIAAMLSGIAQFLEDQQPDAVLVYGDTDSTLAGALAANKSGIPLIHVEAGERSFNASMPEEVNRIVTDALSKILFCVSKIAVKNLTQENNQQAILLSGDVMKDLLLQTSRNIQAPLFKEPYLFVTIHRSYNQSNTEKLKALLFALEKMNICVLFPAHPATFKTIQSFEADFARSWKNIKFIPPTGYTESINYQKYAQVIITDSGGIQKEAYWLKKRCLTFRPETEWIETLAGGWNQLFYEDVENLEERLSHPLGEHQEGLYGNGMASKFITENLIHLLN